MRVVDVHAHVYPPSAAAKVAAWMEDQLGLRAVAEPSPEGLLHEMDRTGVDAAVVFNIAMSADRVEAINAWITGLGSPRLIPFGTLHPDLSPERLREELQRLRGAGVRGIKLHGELQRFDAEADPMLRIYEAVGSDFALLFHCGAGRFKSAGTARASVRALANVKRRFPALRMILAHFGGPEDRIESASVLDGLDVGLDTSRAPGLDSLGRAWVEDALIAFGAGRLMFGTDFPLADQAREITFLREIGLAPRVLEAILGRNAEAFLGL